MSKRTEKWQPSSHIRKKRMVFSLPCTVYSHFPPGCLSLHFSEGEGQDVPFGGTSLRWMAQKWRHSGVRCWQMGVGLSHGLSLPFFNTWGKRNHCPSPCWAATSICFPLASHHWAVCRRGDRNKKSLSREAMAIPFKQKENKGRLTVSCSL